MGIILKNVSFSYDENKVLHDINMEVHDGEHIGVVGTSGVGKSTLLKLLSGLYAPQIGYVEIEGARNLEQIRRKVAVVMQSATLLPASIKDNITCGHPINETIMKQACHAAMLSDWISNLPDGIDTFVGERGGKVSGGQAQRISIARSIAKQAPVILLDEPTSALDGETGDAVLLALKHLTHGKTLIHISHTPETLAECNKIYRLEGGRLHAT